MQAETHAYSGANRTSSGVETAGDTAMAEYLLIESRDPFESHDVGYYYDLARGLVEAGDKVTLFLVQNAVFAARPSAQAPQLRLLVGSGIKIVADDFALKERGITKLLDGVQVAPIDIVVDHLEAGHKTLWH
jgi:sulfur relay (sulfurtransferase) complex TusBCD TusD component (DsrE family)